ncbi:MAG TPA: hypothetical protein PLB95_08965 [Syntrophales bacterium]|nr:hypothetical protein [Syntrophales bacterium]HPX82013.1 hypothetical protein [Syntrophales bacterium]
MFTKSWWCFLILGWVIMIILACGGSLRYVERDPDLPDFHPRSIGVLPVDAGGYDEARGIVEELVSAALTNKDWFAAVLPAATLKARLQGDQVLQQAVNDYLAKLKTVNYSDPALSMKIGVALNMDAFLVVTVDSWSYAVENKEKVARAGLSMRLIDAQTGKTAWRAGHDVVKEYTFLKPELKDLARNVVETMIGAMPH